MANRILGNEHMNSIWGQCPRMENCLANLGMIQRADPMLLVFQPLANSKYGWLGRCRLGKGLIQLKIYRYYLGEGDGDRITASKYWEWKLRLFFWPSNA